MIGNTYIRRLTCEQDAQTGHYVIVAYNGELSELFRFEVLAYSAQTDINGRDITSYVGAVEVDDNDAKNLLIIDGNDDIINTINGAVTTTPVYRQRLIRQVHIHCHLIRVRCRLLHLL